MSRALTGLGVIALRCRRCSAAWCPTSSAGAPRCWRSPCSAPSTLALRRAGAAARRCRGAIPHALRPARAAAQLGDDRCATRPSAPGRCWSPAPTAACSPCSPARRSSSSRCSASAQRSTALVDGVGLARLHRAAPSSAGAGCRATACAARCGAARLLHAGRRRAHGACSALAGVHTGWAIVLPQYAVRVRPRRAPALRPDRRGRRRFRASAGAASALTGFAA